MHVLNLTLRDSSGANPPTSVIAQQITWFTPVYEHGKVVGTQIRTVDGFVCTVNEHLDDILKALKNKE
jgi:hypothetical protein